jgi:hypothetical protein
MCLALCYDTSLFVGLLLFVIVLGAIGATPIVLGVVALLRRADARQKRMAAESPILC